jgi:hypothetical protein
VVDGIFYYYSYILYFFHNRTNESVVFLVLFLLLFINNNYYYFNVQIMYNKKIDDYELLRLLLLDGIQHTAGRLA